MSGARRLPARRILRFSFLCLHERFEVRDRLLHHAGGLHDLRQEHFAGPEQFANDAHAGHERALNHVERATVFPSSLLRILVNEFGDPFEKRVLETLFDRAVPPLLGLRGSLDLADRFKLLRKRDEPLGRVGATVEDNVFDVLQQLFVDLFIDLKLPGVDDAHIQAGLDRVIQKHRVHRFSHGIVATKTEADIADAAGSLSTGAGQPDSLYGFEELDRVVRVLVHPRADSEDVRIEDDVFGKKTDSLRKQLERTGRSPLCGRRSRLGQSRRRP